MNALMRKAEILDAQEDRKYGKGKRGIELPEELRHKQSRLASKADGTPTTKTQRNFAGGGVEHVDAVDLHLDLIGLSIGTHRIEDVDVGFAEDHEQVALITLKRNLP